jgi:hypothetical protein
VSRLREAQWTGFEPQDDLETCEPDEMGGTPESGPVGRSSRPPRAVAALVLAGAAVAASAAIAGAARGGDHHPAGGVNPPVAESAWRVVAQLDPGSGVIHAPLGQAWADQPSATSYSPRYGVEDLSPAGGFEPVHATVIRHGAGHYTVDFHGLATRSGTAEAGAYASNATCYALQWGAAGVNERIDVECQDSGTPSDSPFDVTFRASAA